MRQESGRLENCVKIVLFRHIWKKKICTFLLVHIQFTLSEKPKDIMDWFLKKLNHESWTIKLDHGKKNHLPWSDFMVRNVNRPNM